ncbi:MULTISPECIES: hypothetical protein [unclassified Sulfurospirillum]|uniref:hypothetical protein n=1 Tax=unclassified Sulfurospirillum TaxID=2618290 RepID=UPI000501EEA9|nr:MULTISPECIES: hypothetical protein [unclassified Sulfurospirillum]KFL34983.1 hypothetical protein JU57_03180 [Sulfurospirillum sp. SCADC]
MAFVSKYALIFFCVSMTLIAMFAFLLNQLLWFYVSLGAMVIMLVAHKYKDGFAKKFGFLF